MSEVRGIQYQTRGIIQMVQVAHVEELNPFSVLYQLVCILVKTFYKFQVSIQPSQHPTHHACIYFCPSFLCGYCCCQLARLSS